MAKTPVPAKPEAPKPEDNLVEQAAASEQAPQTEIVEEEAPVGTIPARILVDHGRHRCNTLALLTEAEAANCADWADTSDEAVEYARSLESE